MSALKITQFSGLRPRLPESLLPERAATIAENCDFAYGELRNTKDGYFLNTMRNVPGSIYTDDGLTFYTWTGDVDAVRSPMVSDTFNRLYYSDGTAMKVTSRISTSLNGGPPGTSYDVGVPRPTVAPTLRVAIPEITDGSKYTLTFRFHYEYAGVKYQEQTVTLGLLSGTQATLTPPTLHKQESYRTRDEFPESGVLTLVYEARDTGKRFFWNGSAYIETSDSGTPSLAFPVLRMTAKENITQAEVCDVYSGNSSFAGTGGLWSIDLAKNDGASTYTATLSTGIKEADKEVRAYVYVYRNTYNESGPPSAPNTVTTSPIADVTVTVTKDSSGNYAPIKAIDVYRTPTGSTLAEYFYVGSIDVLTNPAATFTFTDNVKAEMLNEALSSTNYYAPTAGLVGLMSLPNGILCAWKGNELWFSEAYKPWAWPPQYVKPLAATIVGGIAHGSGAIVTTVKHPYVVSGVSSDAMTASRLNVDQAGVSKWSIAVVDGTCMYASHDGLVAITGNNATLTPGQQFFTRETWRARCAGGLSGMRFSVWDGRLVVFHSGAVFTPFMIRFDEADGTLTDLTNLTASCAFISQLSDQFYYAQGTGIYQFNGGVARQAVWQSRETVQARPVNYGIAQAMVDGDWSVQFWAYVANQWQLKHTQAVSTGQATFRLPGGYESDRYKVKITGTGRFRELRMARTGRELATL